MHWGIESTHWSLDVTFREDANRTKMLYLASMNVVKKWTQHYKNWDRVLSQLMIQYQGRFESYI